MTARSPADTGLPPIPNKRYFTIGEVGALCDVKSHVLRYWEQEFSQLKPTKRRGNRRYYQRHDIELIRLIRALLYDQGFTIAGARQQLSQGQRPLPRVESGTTETVRQWDVSQVSVDRPQPEADAADLAVLAADDPELLHPDFPAPAPNGKPAQLTDPVPPQSLGDVRRTLESILRTLEQNL